MEEPKEKAARADPPPVPRSEKDDANDHRGLVMGTPTGGGKYPFLAVVTWNGGTGMDPRESPLCQGAAVAPDVLVLPRYCLPIFPYVVVGDSPNNSSAQFRYTRRLEDDTLVLGFPISDIYSVNLLKIEPVTFEGFFPVSISNDPTALYVDQSLTVAGYGTGSRSGDYPREAYEAQLQVARVNDVSFLAEAPGAGPCRGDWVVPIFDSSMALVGLSGLLTNCGSVGNRFPNFVRISFFADWIERNVCALSDGREALPYCPELVCPRDARLMGYPWALLPNGTGSIFGIRGFEPVSVTQWPPPGTPLWRNTTTNVTITAADAAGRQLECTWPVHVPPLEVVGTIFMKLPEVSNGTVTRAGGFSWSSGQGMGGRVYKLSGRTADHVRGAGSSISANLQKGSSKYTGTLRLQENRTKGAVAVPMVPIRYSLGNFASDVELNVQAERLAQANNVTFMAYGQVRELA